VPHCWPITIEAAGREALHASTRNLAARGVLFDLPPTTALDPGARVRIVVHVPPAHQDPDAYFQFRVHAVGRVVRVEASGSTEIPMRAIAVAFDGPAALVESFVGIP